MTRVKNLIAIKSIAACAVFTLAAGASYAQPVYRIVGPDGKVTLVSKAGSKGA